MLGLFVCTCTLVGQLGTRDRTLPMIYAWCAFLDDTLGYTRRVNYFYV